MTEPTKRRRDSDHKLKKTMYYTPEGYDAIKAYAEEQGITISSATETLALIALDSDIAMTLLPAVASIITTQMNRAQNRFAKLLATAAIEAGAAKHTSHQIYWLLLMQAMDDKVSFDNGRVPTPEAFANQFSVNPDSAEGKALIAQLQRSKARSRYRAVKTLKQPIREWADIEAELLPLEDEESVAAKANGSHAQPGNRLDAVS